jgi:DNA-directed RNA polymerase specialized sigma subunit
MNGPFLKDRLKRVYENLNSRERCVFEYYFLERGYTEEEIGKICWPENPVGNAMVSRVVRDIKIKFRKELIDV